MGYELHSMTGTKAYEARRKIEKATVVFGPAENHGPRLPYRTHYASAYQRGWDGERLLQWQREQRHDLPRPLGDETKGAGPRLVACLIEGVEVPSARDRCQNH